MTNYQIYILYMFPKKALVLHWYQYHLDFKKLQFIRDFGAQGLKG